MNRQRPDTVIWIDGIWQDQERRGNSPCLTGTRFPVRQVLAELTDFDSCIALEQNFDLPVGSVSKALGALSVALPGLLILETKLADAERERAAHAPMLAVLLQLKQFAKHHSDCVIRSTFDCECGLTKLLSEFCQAAANKRTEVEKETR